MRADPVDFVTLTTSMLNGAQLLQSLLHPLAGVGLPGGVGVPTAPKPPPSATVVPKPKPLAPVPSKASAPAPKAKEEAKEGGGFFGFGGSKKR